MCRHLSHKSLSLGLHKWSRHPYVDINICYVMPFIHAIPGKLKARSNVTQVKGDQYVQRWTYNMSHSILVSILGDRFSLSFSLWLWLWLWLLLSRALSPPFPLPLPLSLSFNDVGYNMSVKPGTAAILLSWGKHREESREFDWLNWNHLPDCASSPIFSLTFLIHVNNKLFNL